MDDSMMMSGRCLHIPNASAGFGGRLKSVLSCLSGGISLLDRKMKLLPRVICNDPEAITNDMMKIHQSVLFLTILGNTNLWPAMGLS